METRQSLKDRKLNKYIYLGAKKIKVFRPKEIVKLSESAEIYGDKRIDNLIFPPDVIEKYQDTALLLLKRKSKEGKFYQQEIPPKYFQDSRMHRLASAIMFNDLYKDEGVQDDHSFMKDELGITSNYPHSELKKMFLESKKPSIRIADLKRAIQIWEQESRIG